MKYKDYYEIMGLSRDASPADIKHAYRRLARKFHPDVSKEADAEARFKELGEAYEVLKDPEKRAAYDQLGERWKEGQEFKPPPEWAYDFRAEPGPGAFSDFFENLFGGGLGAGSRGRGYPGKGFDRHAQIDITLEEAFHGTNRALSLERVETGNGVHSKPRVQRLNVKLPAGVSQGQQIRLTGQGDPGPGGGPPGDLFLQVRVSPHRLFRLDGRDVWLDVPVAPWEAALGATVRVPTLSGKVDLTVPKGSQSGRQLRLRGRGLPGSPPGDQHVVLRVVVPPADGPEDEALYRQMASTMKMNPRKALES